MSRIKTLNKKVKPINKNVIVKLDKTPNSSSSAIIDPTENRNIATVVSVASDVQNTCLFNAGKVFIRKINDAKRNTFSLDREGTMIIPESYIVGMMNHKKELVPLGRRILVRRMIDSEQLPSGIIIPYGIQSKDQTLWCVIERFGIPNVNDPFKNHLLAEGERVLIENWKNSYIEVGNMAGGYYLIVNEDDIVYAEYKPDEEAAKEIML